MAKRGDPIAPRAIHDIPYGHAMGVQRDPTVVIAQEARIGSELRHLSLRRSASERPDQDTVSNAVRKLDAEKR